MVFVSKLIVPVPSVILGLYERVGDLFAAVDGANKDEEGASNHHEAEGSGRLISFVVCEVFVSYGYDLEDKCRRRECI
mgnify:CR=1 FL=1